MPSLFTVEFQDQFNSSIKEQHERKLSYMFYFTSRDTVQDVLDMCEQGLISPHISEDFDLEKVNEAMEYMRARKSSGKVVINICDS